YPLLMRAVAAVVGSTYLAGILVTVAAGVGAAALFSTWVRDRLRPGPARAALLLFVLYPYAFFMFGAVYADAVFIVAAIAAVGLPHRPGGVGPAGGAAHLAQDPVLQGRDQLQQPPVVADVRGPPGAHVRRPGPGAEDLPPFREGLRHLRPPPHRAVGPVDQEL